MRISDWSSDVCSSDLLLEPLPGPVIDADDPPPPPRPEQTVRLIGERAAKAILRFKALRSDMVDGGTFADWPLIGLAEIAPTAIRFDPAQGLFGLAIVERSGFLATAENRAVLAGALDREAIVALVRTGWPTTDRILPEDRKSTSELQSLMRISSAVFCLTKHTNKTH